MVEAVLLDSGRILPCCALLSGEYGVDNLYCGVPVELGRKGVRRVVELTLNDEELSALQASVSAVKELAGQLVSCWILRSVQIRYLTQTDISQNF